MYKLDFTAIPIAGPPFGQTALIKASKYLYLKGAIIEYTMTGVTYVVDAGSTNANITLDVKKNE